MILVRGSEAQVAKAYRLGVHSDDYQNNKRAATLAQISANFAKKIKVLKLIVVCMASVPFHKSVTEIRDEKIGTHF